MKTLNTLNTLAAGIVLVLAGCGEGTQQGTDQSRSPGSSAYLLSREPGDVIAVGTARETAQTDQPITIVGRIGGSEKPFVDGIAAFTIVDLKVPYCADDEGCPTPWDYCCQQDAVKPNIATVKLTDESGKTVSGDARELLGVKELSEVVVQGTAKKDDQGNLSLAASKVFVRSGK